MVFRKAHSREGICGKSIILHSDNGPPMKGATMLSTLQKLGGTPLFSRPSVSNDNPYSEALFKTLKYNPGFPNRPFDTIETAREWVTGCQYWYNDVHKHSRLKFVSPEQRHRGEDTAILERRAALYETAKKLQPERWSGSTRSWTPEKIVYLNPSKPKQREGKTMAIAA